MAITQVNFSALKKTIKTIFQAIKD